MFGKRFLGIIPIILIVSATAVPSALAFLPSPGSAGSAPARSLTARSAPSAIPYLSHGIGVDAATFVGTGVRTAPSIPYLSHGVGVSPAAFGGTGVTGVTVSQPAGDGFNWGDAGLGAGSALALSLLGALGLARALRGRKPTIAIS